MRTHGLHRRIKIIRRYREIIEVLLKYGFGEILGRMNIATHLHIGRRRLFEKTAALASKSYSERIRLALEELGPTFIKLGQVLSTRPFLIPLDLVAELSKLQDEVAPFEFEMVQSIVESELGKGLDEIFQSFHRKPVASASLAQVHIAILKDGRTVAVKVQRPNVKQILEVDMEILRDLASLLERFVPESRRFDPSGQVKELAKVSRRECNFLYEARNMEIFRLNFKDNKNIKIPNVHWEYTTPALLVCEYIDGIKISSLDKLRQSGVDLGVVARNGLRAVMEMIFEKRFFHADPHPGNIFVLPDNTLALLDFGMVGHLSESVVDFLSNLLMAATEQNVRKIIRTLLDFDLVPETVNRINLESDITELLYRYHKTPLSQIDMKALSADSMDVFYRHNVRLPASLMLLLKALITAEEVARLLDPEINTMAEVEPYVRKMAIKRFKLSTLKSDFVSVLTDARELLTTLPFELRRITHKLGRGEMEVQFRHRGLDDLTNEINQSSKRVSLALIIAAVLISASMVRNADLGLKLFGTPVLSIFGYLLAMGLTIWLIINILRPGRS